ncbi:NFACT family protein [archaeon AH-315-M20]|nr:NFACT family protein [archaeon AH-315-M20]
MTKQLSSIDMHFLLKELKSLENSRVDKIYNNGKEEIYINFFKSGEGKKILRIISGKAIFLTETKDSDEKPSHFCTMLRKHLDNKTLVSIEQLEPERILKFSFKSKEETRSLYLEIFGKGNLILCKEEYIIESLIKHKFRDRTILPKEKYKHPEMQYNVFDINKNKLKEFFKNSNKDKIVTAFAIELGLGGILSEEVCLLSKLDKNKVPGKIDDKEITIILKSIKSIINKKINPQIVYKNEEATDVVPFDLEFYKECKQTKYPSFDEALDYYFTKEVNLIKKESPYEKQIKEVERIIKEQEDTIKSLKEKVEENTKKGESIYNNYQLIKEILTEINKAKEKYSWEEIKKKLKEHKIVKDVDVKEKKVVVEIKEN